MKKFLKSLDVVIAQDKTSRAEVENNWNESEKKYKSIIAETKNTLSRDKPKFRHSLPENESTLPHSTR